MMGPMQMEVGGTKKAISSGRLVSLTLYSVVVATPKQPQTANISVPKNYCNWALQLLVEKKKNKTRRNGSWKPESISLNSPSGVNIPERAAMMPMPARLD